MIGLILWPIILSLNRSGFVNIQKSSGIDVQSDYREDRVWSHYEKHSQTHIVLHCFFSLLLYHQHEVEKAGQQNTD
jgi:hypothetical protein